ncbi:N-acetylneuraminate synthase family protein [Geobacter sp. DSM 9736]|uniref:N-acetylneuraminate synthase family protein n=1 Tax=Geobacter sp. DSM 9736 TaxID=1277350 RepID=UPI000B4FF013|nr:N-acetylneuraminate synthase family protein [Geobacter sp. DSM 9736]SNB45043.1 N-acetylneuraminate synthase [Geobacter sp. DSM 9736]
MAETIKIGNQEVGGEALFFTIEEGMANLGNLDKARQMVDVAAGTGADAIEFQMVVASDLYTAGSPGHEFCLKCEFSDTQITELVRYVKGSGLECLVAPLSHRLVEVLVAAGCSGFNINASDINNPLIIDAVASSGIPFFLSTLLATEQEIDWAVRRILQRGASRFSLLHGQHTMMSSGNGVQPAQTAIGFVTTLKERYDVPVGFIDHTPYTWMPAAAVSAGADVVTKHMALSRADHGPDWQVCLEPEEMADAVAWARGMRVSVKRTEKRLADGEELDRGKMRRSIVSAKPLAAGSVIGANDLVFKRPGSGVEPPRFTEMIGKVLLRDVEEDEQVYFADFKEE